MVNGLSEEPLSIPTLGRPFFLGMLYDCRSDKILLGVTLWEKETLNVRDVQRHESADFEIIASDTIEDKSSALDVKAGLKLSYLGGMVDVSGSGKYLENRKSSNHVERVTLKYKCTTKTEIMTMEQLGKGKIEHPEVFDHGTATHVVTGITYGGNAYFVFEKELSSDSFDKNVSGNLHIMVNSIPSLKIDGKGQLDLSENETKETQKFRGRYFGDFLPQDNPLTFEEAVRLYKRIPNVIGEKGENSVPISASLYPLAKLDSKACKLVREISAVLVKETENYLEDLYELDVKCNDLLRSQAVNNFRGIEAEIQKFKSLLATYKLGFQKEVAQILPSIRGGNKEESQLAIILKKRESSPFRNEALNRWLEAKETQVKILLQYISYLHEIKFVSKTDLSPMIKNPKHSQILCFSILIPESDSHLINMLKYLKEEDLTSDLDFTDENAKLPPRITENESSMVEKARNFREFFDNNKENTNVSILVTEGVSDSNELQAKIMYYENGKPINGDFAIPSAPRKICVDYSETTHASILVQWEKPLHGASNIDTYKVVCEDTTENNSLITQYANSNATSHCILGLKSCCEYSVSVQSVCQLGVSLQVQISGAVKTRPTSPPGKPEARQISSSEIEIKWSKPLHIGSQCRRIKYLVKKQVEGSDWQVVSSLPFGKQSVNLPVDPDVTCRFKVYCECEHSHKSLDSEASNDFLITRKAKIFKSHLRRHSKEIKGGNIKMYQPKLKLVSSNEEYEYKLQKFEFGEKKDAITKKVIMFVGSTGSGKATLINGIINYIFAVNWDDDFRFKLITEPESHSHAKSQTNKISSYTIHHQEGFRIPYTLTIVDTPDIDIQGIKRDKELSEQIRTVFSTRAIGGISAIAFVVQSSLPRLTPTQRFIFDQILSLFGKDIASNIFLLLTFADCQQPQVLSGIREANIPYRRFFKFNNSALYACSTGLDRQKQGDEDNNFDAAMFWKMGENSFMRFFEVLRLTESKTLALTREVLEELHRKEVSTTGLQIGLYKLEQLRKELEFLISHQADIDRNKNFEYTVTEETFVKEPIPARQFITNCLECRRTCHENCQIKDDDQKQGCWAMKNGNCRICPGHCHWKMHKNSRFKYIYKRAEKTKTTDYLRSRYEEAKKKKLSAKQLIDEVEAELQAVQTKVLGMTETVRKTVKRVREIALKPDPLSIVEYIDAVIGSEKSKAEPGRPAPSMKLQDVRKNMEYLKEIADWTESVYYINNSFS